jgi:hypothetical protein
MFGLESTTFNFVQQEKVLNLKLQKTKVYGLCKF